MSQTDPHILSPPRWADAWLERFCAASLLEDIQGDLHELFERRAHSDGLRRAQLHYWWDVLWFFRPYVLRRESSYDLARGPIMWRNYLNVALRNLRKHKGTSLINLSGLAIGMACCIAVLFFVQDEFAYDQYHEKGDQLYRISIQASVISSGEELARATSPILWAPAMQRDYPEVIDYTRFVWLPDPDAPWVMRTGDTEFLESDILHTDPATLQLFSWPLLQGDAETALNEPTSIVLTESMATKYFGSKDALGQTLTIDPQLRDNAGNLTGQTFDFTITGVLEDIPRQSHFTFDFLLPSAMLNRIYGGDINTGNDLNNWFWRGTIAHSYLHLKEGADPAILEAKFPDFLDRYVGDATTSRGYSYAPYLQRVDQIYLEGNIGSQLQPVGNLNTIYMFGVITLFVLVIACINFMNLTTARSTSRAREVGMRKVVGAHRSQLITQFLSESVLISLVAFVGALVLARLILPVFYDYLGKAFVADYSGNLIFLLSLLGIGLFVGVFAGSYPSFFLSRFRPVSVLKGVVGHAKGVSLRKGLVVFQFVISTFLIIATLTVFNQLQFMRSYDPGYDQERMVVLPPSVARSLMPSYEALKEELLANPQITDVTASSNVPGLSYGGDIYVEKGAPAEDGFNLKEYFVDYNFVEQFDLELIAGRDFSREITTDAGVRDNGRLIETRVILNEHAVSQFGWSSPEEALGKQIIRDPRAGDWTATVIGVMKDFHMESLHNPMSAGALLLIPRYSFLSVKIQPDNLQETLALIEEKVHALTPETDFTYSFLDESFGAQYEEETRLAEVFSYIAFLAIFIACLGLFGLAAFMAEQRTKEIGVRKVLGASILGIVVLISKGFARLVLIAFVIAVPLAYFAMNYWLQDFAYRIDQGLATFLLAGLLALTIALATISYQALKAAVANPVKALRYE